ncbi:MAG: permease prefix domain 1-containing protein [Treponema sp.]|nr:permease prefix domain 1-containing protein [Treponema sp.]
MNVKIKKHVDTLFSHVPYSKKAQELKEEIMADMEAHYNDCLADGESEQMAFRSACDSLGDIEQVIENLIPEKDIMEKIDRYKRFRAIMTSIAVFLYISGVALIVALTSIPALMGKNPALLSVIGTVIFLVLAAFATGMIIFSRMVIPQDVVPYIRKTSMTEQENIDTSTTRGRFLKAYSESHWAFVTIIYFIVSFTTHDWGVTWIIFLIGAALDKCVKAFCQE